MKFVTIFRKRRYFYFVGNPITFISICGIKLLSKFICEKKILQLSRVVAFESS